VAQEIPVLVVGGVRSPSPVRVPATAAIMGALGASTTTKVRFNVMGLSNLRIRTKGTVVGTVNLGAVCVGADAKAGDDTTGTQATTGNPTNAVVANNAEQILDIPLKGEEFVDVQIIVSAASSYQATYIDAYGTELS